MRRKRIRIPLLSEDTLDLNPDLYMFDELRGGILYYISERYRGSFVMEESAALSGYVYVSKDALCFFVRLLLNNLFGRAVLRVSYGQRIDKVFYLRFAYDKSTKFSQSERFRLLQYAKLSKVQFEYSETETDAVITLTMPFHSALFECVYEPKPSNAFYRALSEIEFDESEDREGVTPHGSDLLKTAQKQI